MTTMEIAAEHGVSRQSIHTYRRSGVFPQPVEGEGSTRPRFRADEVAAFFEANPKQPGKKRTDPADQQGEPVVATDQMTLADREAHEQLLNTAVLIEERWPGEHPVLCRDLRDLADTIGEEADASAE